MRGREAWVQAEKQGGPGGHTQCAWGWLEAEDRVGGREA